MPAAPRFCVTAPPSACGGSAARGSPLNNKSHGPVNACDARCHGRRRLCLCLHAVGRRHRLDQHHIEIVAGSPCPHHVQIEAAGGARAKGGKHHHVPRKINGWQRRGWHSSVERRPECRPLGPGANDALLRLANGRALCVQQAGTGRQLNHATPPLNVLSLDMRCTGAQYRAEQSSAPAHGARDAHAASPVTWMHRTRLIEFRQHDGAAVGPVIGPDSVDHAAPHHGGPPGDRRHTRQAMELVIKILLLRRG
jgi:hypothetical protein